MKKKKKITKKSYTKKKKKISKKRPIKKKSKNKKKIRSKEPSFIGLLEDFIKKLTK
tara:strand:- start:62 stop:229 length:168 start_codon:yes stop_codon:yes gene_type:complete